MWPGGQDNQVVQLARSLCVTEASASRRQSDNFVSIIRGVVSKC